MILCRKKKRLSVGQPFLFRGAGDVTRTHDLLITNQLHYRLCYTSDPIIILDFFSFVKVFLKVFSQVGDFFVRDGKSDGGRAH